MTGRTYALTSEYAFICDMRLILREYGIQGEGSRTKPGKEELEGGNQRKRKRERERERERERTGAMKESKREEEME